MILVLLIILLLCNYSLLNWFFIEKFESNKTIDIIVARYNEDLYWTTEEPYNKFKYIVYNKGNNEDFFKINVTKIINLPNVGRCDHTYIYHIINNYYNLADINVFFTGSLELEHKKIISTKILNNILHYDNAVFINHNENLTDILNLFKDFNLTNWTSSYKKNCLNEEKLLQSNYRPFFVFKNNFFQNHKECNLYTMGGVFSVNKKDILSSPIELYKNIIKELDTHSNPEAGHFVERSWCYLFNGLKNTKIIT